MARKAMLIDTSKCMGCRGCQVSCKQWNQRPAEQTKFTGSYQNPPKLSASTWTLIQFIEPEGEPIRWLFRKQQCFHCGDPACVSACPTGALKQSSEGLVFIDQKICAGCKYCVHACPFKVPHTDHTTGTARKCWMCKDRIDNGLKPACVTACPSDAVLYGFRIDMLKEAKRRQTILEKAGHKVRIYGETELGGLGVLTLLTDNASVFGLPEQPKKPMALPRWLLGIIPGSAILYGLWRTFAAGEEKSAASQSQPPQQPENREVN